MSDASAVDAYPYTDAAATWNGGPVYRRVLEGLAGLPPGAHVLDAGCGNGLFAGLLQNSGFTVSACDTSPSGIAIGQRTYPAIDFRVGTAEVMPAESFDAITSVEVIEHLALPLPFLSGLHRALKPGGRLVLSTPYHGFLKLLAIVLLGKFDAHFDPIWEQGHLRFYSKRTLTRVLEKAGFANVQISGVGRLPWLWTSMVATATRR